MVLTDLPFARSSRLESRYNLIRPVQRSESAPPGKHGRPDRDDASNTSSEEYATFLKQKERSVGPDGFLDSSRYCHPFQTRGKKSPRKPTTSQSMRTLPTGATLSARISEDDKNYEKRLKVIEDHMWHHKQEGRELKRLEGDVLKNQQAVRRSLRDYENVVSKKRRNEEKKLSKGLEKYTVLQLENSHRKEELNKQRTHDNINKGQRLKDVDRKALLIEVNIRRQFELKKAELELKQDQRMKTNKAYEEKIRTQEEEEFRLQKELAELAIGLNMEAQKRRQMTFDNDSKQKRETTKMIKSDLAVEKSLQSELTKGDEIIKDAEMTKRKLSAGLERTKAHMSIKARDEQRRLTDTQIRLADNASMQRQLNDAAKFADLDLKAKKIDQRLQAHTERREAQLSSRFKDKREREEAQHVALQEKFRKRYNEQRRKDHDDKLKFFQKMATKAEETEQNLYNKVRNAEYARQKQEQTIKHLQMELANLKRENAKRINSEMAACLRTEKEYEERLLREKADLDKAHARREESYGHLQNHRVQMKEDLYQLQEYSREQERLNKIGLRSESESHLFP